MNVIHNKNGDIIQRSKNLAGIRRYAKNGIESVRLTGFKDGTGLLTVYFLDGASSTVHFASFEVEQMFVRNWRNAHGASLTVNGLWRGKVSTREPRDYPATTEVMTNIEHLIQANDGISRDIVKAVWQADVVHLPKVERIAEHAFETANQMFRRTR